eukprot:scaffold19702_cov98-Isochrysis_galbana.AAC.4
MQLRRRGLKPLPCPASARAAVSDAWAAIGRHSAVKMPACAAVLLPRASGCCCAAAAAHPESVSGLPLLEPVAGPPPGPSPLCTPPSMPGAGAVRARVRGVRGVSVFLERVLRRGYLFATRRRI